MFRFLRNWYHKRIIARSPIPAAVWPQVMRRLPFLNYLPPARKQALVNLAILFLHKKHIVGAHGLEITPFMQAMIAVQACLPILELGIDWYDGWITIIVYPEAFRPLRVEMDSAGVEHHYQDTLTGEAWENGPVILSWADTLESGKSDGHNLVIHEFAHKLDILNGVANGYPPLHRGMDRAQWTEALAAAYENAGERYDRGETIGIDSYALESPAEFFAVVSEVFFERPEQLQAWYPEVYNQLQQFYRQDPAGNITPRYAGSI